MGDLMGTAPGFFDVDDRLRRLSDLGDQLEAYGQVVDFEAFRPDLEKALAYTSGAHGGRPPYDAVMMLKVLVIQSANNLSDERTGFLINDRLSFMRFLGVNDRGIGTPYFRAKGTPVEVMKGSPVSARSGEAGRGCTA